MEAAVLAKNGKCEAEMLSKLDKFPNLSSGILGRTTIAPPIEGVDKVYDVLRNGTRAPKY